MRLTWLLLAAFVLLFAVQTATAESTDLVEGESAALREKRFWWLIPGLLFAKTQYDGGKAVINELINGEGSFWDRLGNGLKQGWEDIKNGWKELIHGTYDIMSAIHESIETGNTNPILLTLARVFTGNFARDIAYKVKASSRQIEEMDRRVFSEIYNKVNNKNCVNKYRDMAVNLRQFHWAKTEMCTNFATGTLAKTGLFIARTLTKLAPAAVSMASDLIQAPANPSALISFGATAIQTIAVDAVKIVDDGKKNHRRNSQLVRLGYKCMEQLNEKSKGDWDRLLKYLENC